MVIIKTSFCKNFHFRRISGEVKIKYIATLKYLGLQNQNNKATLKYLAYFSLLLDHF